MTEREHAKTIGYADRRLEGCSGQDDGMRTEQNSVVSRVETDPTNVPLINRKEPGMDPKGLADHKPLPEMMIIGICTDEPHKRRRMMKKTKIIKGPEEEKTLRTKKTAI